MGGGNKAHIAMLCSARDTMLRALHEISLSPAYLRSEVAICPPHTYVVNIVTKITLLRRYGGRGIKLI